MGAPIVHFEINAKDSKRAAQFYGSLFKWDINANNPMNYGLVSSKGQSGINGGIGGAANQEASRVVVYAEKPRQAPVYFLVDYAAKTADILNEAYPLLEGVTLGEQSKFTYQARDGQTNASTATVAISVNATDILFSDNFTRGSDPGPDPNT